MWLFIIKKFENSHDFNWKIKRECLVLIFECTKSIFQINLGGCSEYTQKIRV